METNQTKGVLEFPDGSDSVLSYDGRAKKKKIVPAIPHGRAESEIATRVHASDDQL